MNLEDYERIPEWIRWILFLPIIVIIPTLIDTLIIVILNVINLQMGKDIYIKGIYREAFETFVLVGAAHLTIPRGKILVMYLISGLFALWLFLTIVLQLITLDIVSTPFSWQKIISPLCLLLVSFGTTIYLQKK